MVEKEGRHMSRCAIGSRILGKRNAGSVAVSDDSENLSDIDDTEVSGYINTEKEAALKMLIWEAMHKKYMKQENGKRMKQPSKERRSTSVKKTVNLEQEKQNEKKRSSKINYDALAGLLGEPLEAGEAVKGGGSRGSDSGDHEPIQSNDEKYEEELDPETEDNEEETNLYNEFEDEGDEYGAGEEFECW